MTVPTFNYKDETIQKYLEKVTPEIIAEAARLSMEWSWVMTGTKLGFPSQAWLVVTVRTPGLLALREMYNERLRMKKRFHK